MATKRTPKRDREKQTVRKPTLKQRLDEALDIIEEERRRGAQLSEALETARAEDNEQAMKARRFEETNEQQAQRIAAADENAGRLSNRLRHLAAADERVTISYVVMRAGKALSEGITHLDEGKTLAIHVYANGDSDVHRDHKS